MVDSVTVLIHFPYWTAYRANLHVMVRTPQLLASAAFFPLVGVGLLYLWARHSHSLQPGDVALLVACLAFTPVINAVGLYLGRRQNPLAAGPFTYVFDAGGIHARNPAFESTIRWATIRRVIESSEFILFFMQPTGAIAIPKRDLVAAGVLDRVLGIARNSHPVGGEA